MGLQPLPSAAAVGCDASRAKIEYKHADSRQGYHLHLKDDCTKRSANVATICSKICTYLTRCQAYEAYGGTPGFNCLLFSSFQGLKREAAKDNGDDDDDDDDDGNAKLTGSGYQCSFASSTASSISPSNIPSGTNTANTAWCHLATQGEQCYDDVQWAMTEGIYAHPEWYPGLSKDSAFSEFQAWLSGSEASSCKPPCPHELSATTIQ